MKTAGTVLFAAVPGPSWNLELISPASFHAEFGPMRLRQLDSTKKSRDFSRLNWFSRVTGQERNGLPYGAAGDAQGHKLPKCCRVRPISRQKKPGREAPVVSLERPGSSSRRSGWNCWVGLSALPGSGVGPRAGVALRQPPTRGRPAVQTGWRRRQPSLASSMPFLALRHPSLEKRPSLASST